MPYFMPLKRHCIEVGYNELRRSVYGLEELPLYYQSDRWSGSQSTATYLVI
jgi:hypothetical protein